MRLAVLLEYHKYHWFLGVSSLICAHKSHTVFDGENEKPESLQHIWQTVKLSDTRSYIFVPVVSLVQM